MRVLRHCREHPKANQHKSSMTNEKQVEQLIRRAYNSIRLTRAVRTGLLFLWLFSLFTSMFADTGSLGNAMLIGVCVVWVGLSIQARRKANLTTTASQLIAAGQLSEAREVLSGVCRGLCIHKPVLLLACHNLAVILQKQRQWLAAWQFCELVRNWARKKTDEIRILSETVRAECSLAMNNLAGAYESLSVLSETSLNITGRLSVLQAEITYSIRVGRSDMVMAEVSNKMALAGLLSTEQAGLAHASLALAAQLAGQAARRDWLWQKAGLYCPAEELLAKNPIFEPVAEAVSTAKTQACTKVGE